MATIYKIYNDKDCYVGSTTRTLGRRLAGHKCCKDCVSRLILENGNYKIEVIEEVSIEDRRMREQYWIDKLSTLKQNKAYIENSENYWKDYHIENKEKIHQKKNAKYTCECGDIYSQSNKSRHLKTLKHMDWWINSLD